MVDESRTRVRVVHALKFFVRFGYTVLQCTDQERQTVESFVAANELGIFSYREQMVFSAIHEPF